MNNDDFFSAYFSYVKETEVPLFFHRWSAIAGLGALLGRQFYFSHGHFHINPNIYCMLIGNPGTRKSTAIKIMRQLLVKSGYEHIAADKTTKEKFLLDLDEDSSGEGGDSILDKNLWGESDDDDSRPPAESFITADEFNDFFGNSDVLGFLSMLGVLWDFNGTYRNKIKNGKSVVIPNPTISILGGNTPTGFSTLFPPEAIGQGFFSRLILVYGEPSGRKITFPTPPTNEETAEVIDWLHRIKVNVNGQATVSETAYKLLDKIYRGWPAISDVRFESYGNRRFTHLLKLCLIFAAARVSKTIEECDVIYANTVLTHTEHLMPKALGEFGKAKHSDVSHKVMQVLDTAGSVLGLKDIWKHVHNDLEKMTDLADILRNLTVAEKIMSVDGKFLTKKRVIEEVVNGVINYEYLTTEEKGVSR